MNYWCKCTNCGKMKERLNYASYIKFFGITIRMQSEKGGKHHKPHIHAIYGDCEIVMALDCETLEVFFQKNN